MIYNYKKHLETGKRLMDRHSHHHQLSAVAFVKLVADCKSNMWDVSTNEFYIGVAVGYRMAEIDRKRKKSRNKGQIRDKSGYLAELY